MLNTTNHSCQNHILHTSSCSITFSMELYLTFGGSPTTAAENCLHAVAINKLAWFVREAIHNLVMLNREKYTSEWQLFLHLRIKLVLLCLKITLEYHLIITKILGKWNWNTFVVNQNCTDQKNPELLFYLCFIILPLSIFGSGKKEKKLY